MVARQLTELLLPGQATVGAWTPLVLDEPTLLQPLWSPVNPSAASTAIVSDPTFIPTLYWVPEESFGAAVNPSVAPLNQLDIMSSGENGRILLPDGAVRICNPNPSTRPVPVMLVPESLLPTFDQQGADEFFGSRVRQRAFNVPSLAGPAATILLWDAFRRRALFSNFATIDMVIAVGGVDPLVGGGFLLNSNVTIQTQINQESPAPWSMHRAVNAGGVVSNFGLFVGEVTR